ncbi:amidohydrolase family protein [Sediminispirochaeta bajacaliforniensis]|uniref:amidohydrolase family protein n=1 Tax=Sediminispirochaeta bajacaliforniensis TaxID=148 RepID=UPI0003790F7C|nr:amidohydrolase family protein [Sediminispirochaeta bajacaliforniensis]
MVIDIHVHPGFYENVCENKDDVDFRKKAMGWDLMSPFPVELTRKQMQFAGVDRLVLLPLDLTTQMGGCVITNEEIRGLVDSAPDLFYGFASVDPFRKNAVEIVEKAFEELHLMGLKLHPSKQGFYPQDPIMDDIYQKCLYYNKPILFHAGMSWEPKTPMKYSHPLYFEELAIKYPDLRFCLAHFGWPWIYETVAIVLKYPNVYTDTALLYMDSPEDFFDHLMRHHMGPLWIENNISRKVLFGSNNPRFRTARIKRGIESLNWRPETLKDILGENAMTFLGIEG